MGFAKKVLTTGAVIGAGAVGAAAWALAPRPALFRARFGQGSLPDVPFAHRGLHDVGSGLPAKNADSGAEYVKLARTMAKKAGYESDRECVAPENSLAAFAAACEAGYGIELDLQLTADGQVVVVHDSTLQRVAGDPREISDLTYAQLEKLPLFPSDDDSKTTSTSSSFQHVPLFSDVLSVVDGRVPLIVEYKMGEDLNRELMEKGDALLSGYSGWYCIESFNPLAVAWYRRHRPEILRGQLASPPRGGLRDIDGINDAGRWFAGKLGLNWVGRPDFVAYDWHGGAQFQMKVARALGAIPVAWTVRDETERLEAEPNFDFMIFESFVPDPEY